jgi:hypothetical protein
VPPHLINVLDILALLLGIFFSTRRGWMRARVADEQPHVPPEAFARWKQAELMPLTVLVSACFAKVLAAPGWLLLAPRLGIGLSVMRWGSAAIDIAWLGVVFFAMARRRSARRLGDELQLEPGRWRERT